MRFFQNASFDFLGKRRTAYVISGIALVVLLASALFFQFSRGSWLNYGVDFLGGTLVQVQVDRETDVNEMRGVVNSVISGTEVTLFGAADEFLIRAPSFESGEQEVSDLLVQAMNEHYGAGTITVERTEAVSPKIGEELQSRAILALLVSFAFTLVYLAFRFEWRFGVAAVVATVHDILLSLGFISLFQLDVSLPTVAAVLTIIGYSLNDTIVIFDRVRENLASGARRLPTAETLNRSINETLPRTIMTSMTTVGALLALFLLGGEIIRDFALILILGVMLGTYSSIMVASPVLFEIEQRFGKAPAGGKKKKEGARAAL